MPNFTVIFSTSEVRIAMDLLGPGDEDFIQGLPFQGNAEIVMDSRKDCATLYIGRMLESPLAKFDLLGHSRLPFGAVDFQTLTYSIPATLNFTKGSALSCVRFRLMFPTPASFFAFGFASSEPGAFQSANIGDYDINAPLTSRSFTLLDTAIAEHPASPASTVDTSHITQLLPLHSGNETSPEGDPHVHAKRKLSLDDPMGTAFSPKRPRLE